jgi:tetratricopeptide (TPR) repeat protein
VQGDILGSYTGDTAGALASYRKGLAVLDPWDHGRETGLRRMSLLHRLGDLQTYMGKHADAFAAYDEAIHLGSTLRERYPSDAEVRSDLAVIYQALARVQRLGEDQSGALANQSKALALLQESLDQNPTNDRRQAVATAHSMLGVIQQNLDQLQEAKASLQKATTRWDELTQAEPLNANYQRMRMFAYSHLGEILGSPAHVNLGDYAGALAGFGVTLDIARKLYDGHASDVAATVDYGMALMRLASVPLPDGPKREALYRKSIELLSEVAARVPQNKMNVAFLASDHEMLGDLLAESGKPAEAREEYRKAFTGAANVLGAPAFGQRVYVTAGRKLAADAARSGNETAAFEYANKTLAVAEKSAAEKKAPVGSRVLVPRAYATMGDIHEILRRPAEARNWRERSLAAFRDLETQREFNSLHRAEMQRVEMSLKKQ